MELVIDANILISALIRDSHTRHFLLLSGHSFSAPEYIFEEINSHIEEIKEKTFLSESDVKGILSNIMILGNIKVIPLAELYEYCDEAKRISPDIDDTAYFALALKQKCAIWSNDKELKEKQDIVKVYSSKEVLNIR